MAVSYVEDSVVETIAHKPEVTRLAGVGKKGTSVVYGWLRALRELSEDCGWRQVGGSFVESKGLRLAES